MQAYYAESCNLGVAATDSVQRFRCALKRFRKKNVKKFARL